MDWYYDGQLFDLEESLLMEYQGFVYLIEELDTGMKYIGKKFFWKPKILPVTKTRKRRKKTIVESDWKSYYGSNKELREKIGDGSNYRRTILRLCRTKGECSYYEAKYQFENDVLLREDYYNELIHCRINSNNMKAK